MKNLSAEVNSGAAKEFFERGHTIYASVNEHLGTAGITDYVLITDYVESCQIGTSTCHVYSIGDPFYGPAYIIAPPVNLIGYVKSHPKREEFPAYPVFPQRRSSFPLGGIPKPAHSFSDGVVGRQDRQEEFYYGVGRDGRNRRRVYVFYTPNKSVREPEQRIMFIFMGFSLELSKKDASLAPS